MNEKRTRRTQWCEAGRDKERGERSAEGRKTKRKKRRTNLSSNESTLGNSLHRNLLARSRLHPLSVVGSDLLGEVGNDASPGLKGVERRVVEVSERRLDSRTEETELA